MLYDQQIELFELRLHGIDIILIKNAVSPCASLLPYLNTRLLYASYPFWSGTSRTIFRGPFVVSSARMLLSVLALSFSASSVGIRFTLGLAATARSSVNNSLSPYISSWKPAFVLASWLLWVFTRLRSTQFQAKFPLAAQYEGVLNSAPLPCKVRQVSHVCCARCDGKCV